MQPRRLKEISDWGVEKTRVFIVPLILVLLILLTGVRGVQAQGVAECPALPSGSPAGRPTILATDIQKAVANGCEVVVREVTIEGPLILLSVDTPTISGKLAIADSTFTDEVFLGSLTVQVPWIIFTDSKFEAEVTVEDLKADASKLSTSQLLLDFSGVTFGKSLTIRGTDSLRIELQDSVFEDSFNMLEMEDIDLNFEAGEIRQGAASFDRVGFKRANFRNATLNSVAWREVSIEGELWPPAAIDQVSSGLTWNFVKDFRPPALSSQDFFGQWENIFSRTGRLADVREIRASRRRSELFPVWLGLLIGFAAMVPTFSLVYWWWFRRAKPERGWRGRIAWYWSILLFSFDIGTPGLDAPGLNWQARTGLHVESIPVPIVMGHRFLGWGALVVASAVVGALLIV